MLCREMAGEGVPWFDLSPGGEYKDRIATRHEMSYDLRVHLGALPAARARARRTAVRLARTAAARLGDERAARVEAGVHALAARAASTVRRAGAAPAELPAALARRARRAVSSHVELRVYSMPAERARALPDAGVMRRDAIDDLLCYRPAGSDAAPRQAFYASSMARLARDCHVYTHRVGDDLAHYGWLWEREERSVLAEVGRALRLPPNSAMLFDYYTHPAYRGQGLYGGSLRQMARAAALVADTEWVFITVHADNGASRRVIEKVGFDYRFSFFEERRLGAVRRWSTSPPEFDGGELDAVPPAAEGGAPATADEG
jgi:predicted GNAT family acetyltransferase